MSSPSTPWGVSDQYVILDTFEKLEDSNTSNGELKFNFGFQQPTYNNIIGINGTLTKIIEVQIASFYLPSVPLLPYITNDAYNINGVPVYPPNSSLPRLTTNTAKPEVYNAIGTSQSMACFGGRLGIEFKEMNAQSNIALAGTRFHFEMQANLAFTATNVIVSPLAHGFDKVFFTDPIRSLTNLTVNIKNPDDGIFLPPDVLYNVSAFIDRNSNGYPVLAFRIVNQNHDILVNDRIYFLSTDFSDGENDISWKNIDIFMNSLEGMLVGM